MDGWMDGRRDEWNRRMNAFPLNFNIMAK